MNSSPSAPPVDFPAASPPVAGLILAGGRASRMGGADKGRLAVGGVPILTRIVAVLRPQVARLVLNRPSSVDWLEDGSLVILPDELPDHGPLAGLLAGLEWALTQNLAWVLSVPTDTPFLPADLLSRLAPCLKDGQPAAIAVSGRRRHPVIGLWRSDLAPTLRRALVEERLVKAGLWARQCGAVPVAWPLHPIDPFFNVNGPEDLAEAERMAGRQAWPTLHA